MYKMNKAKRIGEATVRKYRAKAIVRDVRLRLRSDAVKRHEKLFPQYWVCRDFRR